MTQTSDKYFGAVAKCTGLPESKYLEDKINLMLKESKLLNENLIINCALVKYHKGSRARRYWNYGNRIGVGYSEVNVDITNKNNKEIYKFNVYQEITWGNFGGNPKWMLENTAKEIVKEVKNKLISKENNGH